MQNNKIELKTPTDIIGFILALLIIGSVLALPLWGLSKWKISEGEKIGYLTKLSDEGIFVKTHEAEMVRGGLNQGTGVLGNSFKFTVKDVQVVETLRQAMDENKEVKVHYYRIVFTMFSSESHNYFVDSVKVK